MNFERAMDTLFAHLTAAATIVFTADATDGQPTLTNASSVDGLFQGLPVFGDGISRGSVIAAVDAAARTVTLSTPIAGTTAALEVKTGFLTAGRRVQHWQTVTDQPALFLRRTGTTDEYSGHLPITTVNGEIWLYSRAGEDPSAVPDVALSNLDAMMRASLAPDDDGRCTLSGLVYWCRIEGHSDYSPGDQGGQGISRIPVRITLPF